MWFEVFWDADGVAFPPRESQGVCSLPGEVFKGDHPHSDQVTAVNALVTLSKNSFDSLMGRERSVDTVPSFL